MGSSSLSWDTSFGVTVSNSHAPTINAAFSYTPAYNGTWRYPPDYLVDREGGSLAGNDGADHHSIVVDSDTCTVWETYHAYVNPANGSIETGKICNGSPCNAQSGWKYNPTDFALPTEGTTDAAGLPLLPLIWRGHEILDGTLNHPVRFTLHRGYIQAGNPQWPAEGSNGWGGKNNPSYGTRFRLKANTNIDFTGLNARQQVLAGTIVTALQRYGLIVADIGTNMNAVVDDEAAQDPNVMAALGRVGSQVTPAQLEAVDLSSLTPATPSYLVANSTPSAPQVMVGTPYHTFLNIQAGTTIQLRSWVNGPATNKGIDWQVLSGDIGAVTSDGIYTASSSGASTITHGVLEVISQADPTASSTIYVRVIPSGPIRISAGNFYNTVTDKLGQTWLPNIFFRSGNTVMGRGDYPGWPTPSDTTQAAELNIYESFSYTYGNDQVAHFFVPNGTYSVRWMFGQAYHGTPSYSCSPFPTYWHNFIDVEVQNTISVTNYDFGAAINHACAVPVDLNVSADVVNNVLELALRDAEPDNTGRLTSPMFSGVEIIRTN